MSLIMAEGFDWIDEDGNLLDGGKWIEAVFTTFSSVTPTGVGQSVNIGSSQYVVARTSNSGESDKIIVGFALKLTNPANKELIVWEDGGVDMLTLRITEIGAIEVRNGTDVVHTSSQRLMWNVWQYLEVKVLMSDTVGTVETQLNGQNGGESTGLDTKIVAGTLDRVRILGSGSFFLAYFYIGDTSGGFDFLGESIVTTLFPNANNSVQFTRNGGPNNFSRLDEVGPDDDTTYNSSTTDGHEDTFDFAAFGTGTDVIAGVGVNLVGKIVTEVSGDFRHICITGSTDVGDAAGVTTAYTNMYKLYLVDPHDSAAWTQTVIDAAKFGYRIIV